MPVNPYEIIGEILGTPAIEMSNPVNADYLCPFVNSQCLKRSQRFSGPFPVCSIYRKSKKDAPVDDDLIAICPKRFYEIDLLKDVLENCWEGEKPSNPQIAHEVKMADLGTVDFVVADYEQKSNMIKNFVSVELQAVDITGSYEPAYTSILCNNPLEKRPTYNFNYANVRKRFLSQLIGKGFYHHHWGTKIVAILQEQIFERVKAYADFPELSITQSNIVFMLYKFANAPEKGEGHKRPILSRVVGTNHNSLMMGVLYKTPPSKDEFCQRILKQIVLR